jgi:hypothetical protein
MSEIADLVMDPRTYNNGSVRVWISVRVALLQAQKIFSEMPS